MNFFNTYNTFKINKNQICEEHTMLVEDLVLHLFILAWIHEIQAE